MAVLLLVKIRARRRFLAGGKQGTTPVGADAELCELPAENDGDWKESQMCEDATDGLNERTRLETSTDEGSDCWTNHIEYCCKRRWLRRECLEVWR